MHEHSSKWIGGQDVAASTLENAMLQLASSASTMALGHNAGVYNLKEHHKMTSAGEWNKARPTFDRENVAVGYASQPRLASSIIRSGRLILNNNFCGMYDLAYHNGNLDLNNEDFSGSRFDAMMFTGNTDTHWALIFINGNLELDMPNIIRPPVRKLGMCIYVTGNLIANGIISMTNRGANHSGAGISHGYTAPVAIPLNGTLTIPAAGGAGGARAESGSGSSGTGAGIFANAGTAADGSLSSTSSGGGASGGALVAVNGTTTFSGAGSAGTCFSGGIGGAGSMCFTGNSSIYGATGDDRHDAQTNGGAGGQPQNVTQNTYGGSGGCGNPGGFREKNGEVIVGHEYGENWAAGEYGIDTISSQARPPNAIDGANGTGGTCVVMCAGTYSGSGKLRATGHTSYMYHDGIIGGAGGSSGGGVFISLYGTDSSGPTPTCSGGAQGNMYSDTNGGGAGTGLKAAL